MKELNDIFEENLQIIFGSRDQKCTVYDFFNSKDEKSANRNEAYRFADKMASEGLITRNDDYCFITGFGNKVISDGGWKRHLENEKIRQAKEEEKENKRMENLESQTKVNQWLIKTKWIPYIISLVGLVISILALLKSMNII